MNTKGLGRRSLILASICLLAGGQVFARSIYFDHGLDQFRKHHYKEARAYFEQVIKDSPYDAGARYYLGLCCQQLADHNSARVQFDWVARYAAEPTLKAYATKALLGLDKAAGGAKKGSAVKKNAAKTQTK